MVSGRRPRQNAWLSFWFEAELIGRIHVDERVASTHKVAGGHCKRLLRLVEGQPPGLLRKILLATVAPVVIYYAESWYSASGKGQQHLEDKVNAPQELAAYSIAPSYRTSARPRFLLGRWLWSSSNASGWLSNLKTVDEAHTPRSAGWGEAQEVPDESKQE